ncbi:hypothetical protein [Rhodoferax ferrireducens]|nr:hypothetical protein [Rhodoferax ferrireducens]WPC66442.1 hypothetical protein SBP18_18490 [Rhodoferax ferrireducens]
MNTTRLGLLTLAMCSLQYAITAPSLSDWWALSTITAVSAST